MLEAIAGRPALERAYAAAHAGGYLWHEFGDTHLLLPERRPMNDDRVAPALPDGRRAVVYALRRRGQATADDIARQLDMTVSRRAPAPHRAGRRRPCRSDRAAAPAGSARPRPARVHGHRARRRAVPQGLRRAHQRAARLRVRSRLRSRRHALPAPPRRTHPQRDRAAGQEARRSRPRSPSSRGSSTTTATSPRTRRPAPACSASSSTTARSGRSPSATGRPAPSELDFIRSVLPDADVDRVQHMVAGAPHCAYEVRARAA